MDYYAKGYTPVSKTIYTDDPKTTLTVWSPGTNKKIVLTDFIVTTESGYASTMRLYRHTSADPTAAAGVVVLDFAYSSANVNSGFSQSFSTPIEIPNNNGIIRIVGNHYGFTTINCLGFEKE